MEDQLLAENLCLRSNPPNDQKLEPGHLLEDSWFFGNLLDIGQTKTMIRCMSDPSPSSSPSSNSKPSSRTPPLEKMKKKIIRNQETGINSSYNLPPEEDPDNEFALSRLIRQASLTSSDVFLPPKNRATSKKNRSAPRPVQGKSKDEKIQQVQKQKPSLRKSVSNLEMEVGIFDHKREDIFSQNDNKQKSRTNYAWNKVHISNSDRHSQVPNWIDNASSAEDVKAQIKFWARSVAANVRS